MASRGNSPRNQCATLLNALGRGSMKRRLAIDEVVEARLLLQQVAGGAVTFDFRYWYDTANRRTRFFNGIDTLTYSYGTDGLLAKLKVRWAVDAGGFQPDSFRFKWDGLGRRDSVIYTNGTRGGFGYDPGGRPRPVWFGPGGGRRRPPSTRTRPPAWSPGRSNAPAGASIAK